MTKRRRETTGPDLKSIIKGGTLGVIALAIMGASFALFQAERFASREPQSALRLWPDYPRALAELAGDNAMGTGGSKLDQDAARQLAIMAFQGAPATRGIFSVFAITESDADRAETFARLAATNSRRDMRAQLMLIERAAAAGDLDSALEHYDIALTVSTGSHEMLFPVLADASARHPVLAKRVAQLFASDPVWMVPFVNHLIGSTNPVASDGLLAIHKEMRTAGQALPEAQNGTFLARLEREGRYRDAFEFYGLIQKNPLRELVRNGDLESRNAYPPIDWAFDSEAEVGAEIAAGVDNRSHVMMVWTDQPGSRRVARQLLSLDAGARHDLSLVTSGSAGGSDVGLRVEVSCIDTGRPLGAIEVSKAGSFTVPLEALGDGCPYQWLQVLVRGESGGETVWIDDIGIRSSR